MLVPDNIGLLSEDNQFYILCNLVNNAAYYFLPFFVAYSAAKKFQVNPVMTMLLTAIMLHPDMRGSWRREKPFISMD
ncbi:hypothetical protein D5278_14290 [bacterium 1XD21-13]|nr:hypothetical protein [bacterium 1XD21-13]